LRHGFPDYWQNLYDRRGIPGEAFPPDQWAQRPLAAADPGGGDAFADPSSMGDR
jgi:hypothetical protein